MGMVLGKVSVETPKYEVVGSGEGYEVRQYGASIVAEVECEGASNRDGFMQLADYIGAVGKPRNAKPQEEGQAEKIAMTAPVLTQQSAQAQAQAQEIAPVLTQAAAEKGTKVMQFVLPSKYTSLEGVPRPLNPRVMLKAVPARKYGAVQFSGVADEKLEAHQTALLRNALEAAGYQISGPPILAQYNPPWTIPSLRTNEVLLPLAEP